MPTLEHTQGKFIFRCTFSEKDLPKDARFRWDGTAKVWWTDDERKASTLARFAIGTARTMLHDHITHTVAQLEASRAMDTEIDIPVPEGRTLYPYQRAGVAYAMARDNTLIADEMGLGKSCQSLVLINTDPTIKRVLIICPASLKINWQREAKMWIIRPMSFGIAAGDYFPRTDIVCVNYDIVARHRPAIDAIEWDYLIVDESHYLKSPKAERTCAVLGGTVTKSAKRNAASRV